MSMEWRISIYEQQQLVCSTELTGAVELGRQDHDREVLHGLTWSSGIQRLVIARASVTALSRHHVQITPLVDGRFQITNLTRASAGKKIGLPDGKNLRPQEESIVDGPFELFLGERTIRGETKAEEPEVQQLAEPTLAPGQSQLSGWVEWLAGRAGEAMDVSRLIRWLQTAMSVLQGPSGDAAVFDRAAQALVDLVHLDAGRILLLDTNQWQTRAAAAGGSSTRHERPISQTILRKLLAEKRTFLEIPKRSNTLAQSLQEVEAVVAAPILDRDRKVIGALYGDRVRQNHPTSGQAPISKLEMALVELLAWGVAAELARQEQEKAALAARIQFEQFFTPELAHHLTLNPNLLEGREAEVTVMFCDIRGFSRISEKIGPALTLEWINDVMSSLSEVVRDQQGVLVDYIGDELMAMWGAPDEKQTDHADRACQTALGILELLPQLNARWQPRLQETLSVGIGINTGLARVGNTGARQKFKYGPLGPMVNLASRVQGASKYFKTSVLITGSVQARLQTSLSTRKLCRVRVVNITEPVDLHELVAERAADWALAKGEYEEALKEFENRQFSEAARRLGNLRAQRRGDAPALLLLLRAVQSMVDEPAQFDPVWVLPGK